MALEEMLRQKRKVVRRYPSTEALEQIERGSKFIAVENNFDLSCIPQGYTLIDMKHKGESFKTLIPQSLLFYMANPGEGDSNQALEEIADFYGEAEDFEDDMIGNGETNVQEANWATLARGNYETYLVNRLVKHKKGDRDREGEPVPEFDKRILHGLDLDDDYVSQRVKAIAALALGKTADQINTHEIEDVLKHITIGTKKSKVTEKLTREEFEKITCWAGSHYEIKSKYRNGKDVSYNIDHRHDREHKIGTRTTSEETDVTKLILDAKIGELEGEISKYRAEKREGKSRKIGRHDEALIRQYTNLAHIAPESPRCQLYIKPPEKIMEKEK